MQTMAQQLGDKVEKADHHEYGYAQVRARGHSRLLTDIEDHASPEGYGLQFHPEVTHTNQGVRILQHFVRVICACVSSAR